MMAMSKDTVIHLEPFYGGSHKQLVDWLLDLSCPPTKGPFTMGLIQNPHQNLLPLFTDTYRLS